MHSQSKSQQVIAEYQQNDSKVSMEREKAQNSQYNTEWENKVGGLTLSDFEIYYEDTLNRTAWSRGKIYIHQ